jgi:hypothetical protein
MDLGERTTSVNTREGAGPPKQTKRESNPEPADEEVHLSPARAAVPVRLQRHLPALSARPSPALRPGVPPRDDRPVHHLEPDHRHGHHSSLTQHQGSPEPAQPYPEDQSGHQVDNATATAHTAPGRISSPTPNHLRHTEQTRQNVAEVDLTTRRRIPHHHSSEAYPTKISSGLRAPLDVGRALGGV